MPARKGATALNLSLPDALVEQLTRLVASGEFQSKSEGVERCLTAYLEGTAQEVVETQVQRRLDTLTQALKDLTRQVEALATPATTAAALPIPARVELRLKTLDENVKRLYDLLTAPTAPARPDWLTWIRACLRRDGVRATGCPPSTRAESHARPVD